MPLVFTRSVADVSLSLPGVSPFSSQNLCFHKRWHACVLRLCRTSSFHGPFSPQKYHMSIFKSSVRDHLIWVAYRRSQTKICMQPGICPFCKILAIQYSLWMIVLDVKLSIDARHEQGEVEMSTIVQYHCETMPVMNHVSLISYASQVPNTEHVD